MRRGGGTGAGAACGCARSTRRGLVTTTISPRACRRQRSPGDDPAPRDGDERVVGEGRDARGADRGDRASAVRGGADPRRRRPGRRARAAASARSGRPGPLTRRSRPPRRAGHHRRQVDGHRHWPPTRHVTRPAPRCRLEAAPGPPLRLGSRRSPTLVLELTPAAGVQNACARPPERRGWKGPTFQPVPADGRHFQPVAGYYEATGPRDGATAPACLATISSDTVQRRLFGSRGGQLLRNLDPVAPLGLCPVECGIHRPKDHGSGLSMAGKHRDADGDRNGPNKLVPVRDE